MVGELDGTRGADAVVAALATLAERLGTLRLAADGVNDEAQARALQRAGCRFGSGVWVSGPLDTADFSEVVRAGRVSSAGAGPA